MIRYVIGYGEEIVFAVPMTSYKWRRYISTTTSTIEIVDCGVIRWPDRNMQVEVRVIEYRPEVVFSIPMTWCESSAIERKAFIATQWPDGKAQEGPFIQHWSHRGNLSHLYARSHISLVSKLKGFWQVTAQHWWAPMCACVSKWPNFAVKGQINRWVGCNGSNGHRYTSIQKCFTINHYDLATGEVSSMWKLKWCLGGSCSKREADTWWHCIIIRESHSERLRVMQVPDSLVVIKMIW